jgi:O-antigen/teichoic acid export membrane protein
MLLAIARMLAPSSVGVFAFAMAVTAPVVSFLQLQLRQILVADPAAETPAGTYVALRLTCSVLGMLFIAGVAVLFEAEQRAAVLWAGVSKTCESLSDMAQAFVQQQEQMHWIAFATAVKGIVSLSLFSLALWWSRDVVLAMAVLAMASAAVLIAVDMPTAEAAMRRAGARRPVLNRGWSVRSMWVLAAIGFPLGFVQVLISLQAALPRYVLEHMRDSAELGVFAALSYLVVAGQTVVNASGNAASRRLAVRFTNGDRSGFLRLQGALCAVGAIVGLAAFVGGAVGSTRLVEALFGREYAHHTDLLLWILGGGGIAYVAWFLGFGMTAARKFRQQVPVMVASIATTATVCAVAVPARGATGAAIAMAAGMAVQAAASSVVVWRAAAELQARRLSEDDLIAA